MPSFRTGGVRFRFFAGRLGRNLSFIFERGVVQRLSLAILAFNIISWLWTLFLYWRLRDSLAVLHYNIDFGIDLIGPAAQLFFLPAFLSLISLANLVFLLIFVRRPAFRFVSMFILSGLVFICFLVLLALIALYLVNF